MNPTDDLVDVYVAGYWGPRVESPEEIAASLHAWFTDLQGVNDAFTSWSIMSQPVTTPDEIAELVRRGFTPNEEDGAPVESLGFRVFGDSDADGLPSAEFSVAAGAIAPRVSNSVILDRPYGDPFPREWLSTVVPVIESTVNRWKPEIAVFTSFQYAQALKAIMRHNRRKPGALTWLPVEPTDVPDVVEGQTVTPLAGGALISLMDGENMPESEAVVALAEGLLDAGLLDPQESDEAGETGA